MNILIPEFEERQAKNVAEVRQFKKDGFEEVTPRIIPVMDDIVVQVWYLCRRRKIDASFLERFHYLVELIAQKKMQDFKPTSGERWILERVDFLVPCEHGLNLNHSLAERFIRAVDSKPAWTDFADAVLAENEQPERTATLISLVKSRCR
jgi:hypothetical protein